MSRSIRWWMLALALGFAISSVSDFVTAQEKKADDKKPMGKAILKIKLPTETAELKIDNQPMKTTGKLREFDVVGLDPKKSYEYDVVIKFEPNNYNTITRKKKITFKGTSGPVRFEFSYLFEAVGAKSGV